MEPPSLLKRMSTVISRPESMVQRSSKLVPAMSVLPDSGLRTCIMEDGGSMGIGCMGCMGLIRDMGLMNVALVMLDD